ncbi:MAG: FtsL-like putative cell division protein [Thermonemataceae bacterium]|nr:FtsL-like putative cell division protein [Thermonemataceae bacterium]
MFAENNYKDSAPQTPEAKRSVFSWIDNFVNLDFLVQKRKPINYIPYVLYISALGIFYISNNHYARKLQREIVGLEKEVTNLRSDYTHHQAKYMNTIRYSEVEKKAKIIGLQRVEKVPYQIIIKKKN